MYRIKLKIPFNGERFGMMFSNGLGETDVEFTATRLKNKGYDVTEVEGKVAKYEFDLENFKLPSNPNDITIKQLQEYSKSKDYEGVSNYSKDQLFEYIKNEEFNK